MTRKHYAMIAGRIRRSWLTAEDREPVEALARDMAGDFANENPRFDRERFLKTCGIATAG